MDPCTREWKLTVIASRVHLVGRGAARLVKGDEALANGRARTVELAGAQVRSRNGAWARIEHPLTTPKRIEPFGLLPDSSEYDVTYQAGATIEITASRDVPDGQLVGVGVLPECESGRGCAIVWPKNGSVLRFDQVTAETVDLTGEFPFGQLAPESDRRGGVSRMEVHVTKGTLTCGGEEISLDGLDVTATSVRMVQPIKLVDNSFSLVAEGPPGQVVAVASGMPITTMVAGGGIACAVLIASAVALRFVSRPKPAPPGTGPTPTPWFTQVPLPFDRPEAQATLKILAEAYVDLAAARALAEDAGVSLLQVNFAQTPIHVMRDLMKEAAEEKKLARLLRIAVDDPSNAAHRDQLVKLLGAHEAAFEQDPS